MYLQLWVPENLTPPAFNGTGRGNQYLELSRVFILPRDTKLTPKFKLILNSLQKHTLAHTPSYLHTHTHCQACCFISYICSVTESGSNPRLVLPTFPSPNALQFAVSCCFVERKTAVTIVFLPSQTPHTWALTQSETALSQHKHVCACVCLSAIPAKTSYSFLVLAL